MNIPRRSKLTISLIMGSVLAVVTLLVRVYVSGSFTYVFMIWNLALGWVPYLISFRFHGGGKMRRGILAFWLFLWILFFPNAPYIVTDFIHLELRSFVPLWYDLLLLLFFAWNGMMLGFVSLFTVQAYITKRFGRMMGWFCVLVASGLSGLGVYLGRFLRWNSWDVVSDPGGLLSDIFARIFSPFNHPQTVVFSLLFSLFLVVTYFSFWQFGRLIGEK